MKNAPKIATPITDGKSLRKIEALREPRVLHVDLPVEAERLPRGLDVRLTWSPSRSHAERDRTPGA